MNNLNNFSIKYVNLFFLKKPVHLCFNVVKVILKELLFKIGIKERSLYNLGIRFALYMILNIQNGIDILNNTFNIHIESNSSSYFNSRILVGSDITNLEACSEPQSINTSYRN